MFRGSRYRGVSKNKNKWQVSQHSYLILTSTILIDDDHDQSEKGLHRGHLERVRRRTVLRPHRYHFTRLKRQDQFQILSRQSVRNCE